MLKSQAVITEAALTRTQDAGPDDIVDYVIVLNEGLISDEELETLNDLGMTKYMPYLRQAYVSIPGRHLLSLAELPSVIQVG